ncbi:MAG: CDP-alcohol phosphatidyltransferase family protein [Dehalococcoidales bacterium]|nr:CDP-alcohol phosphatidyltransferase family protein [Dehalococcoidales bacterium]
MLNEVRGILAYRFTEPVVWLLAKRSLNPIVITWIGFLLNAGAGILIINGHLFIAGIVVLIGGYADTIDGALARRTNQVTKFGAILDSTFDRLSEAILLLGLLVLYVSEQAETGIILVSVVLVNSLMVSYIRARAEASGLECRIGLFTRVERVIILVLGLLLSQIENVLYIALGIIAVFSLITVIQRLLYVWKQTQNE